MAERFFATLEHELLAHTVRHAHREAPVALTDFIEHWCDAQRKHSTRGYGSPPQDEHQLRHMAEQRKPRVRQIGSSPVAVFFSADLALSINGQTAEVL